MRIKIAPDDPQSMSQDGDAILRSLQNKSLSMIDLMVRESLQNSLDASLESFDKTIVNFYVDNFESEKLSGHLEGISDELSRRHTGKQKYIAISDMNTTGLTGEYLSNDIDVLNNSNFHKLVFGIGKNQSKEGAGGSWGLGKTSYFRMGVGIVIYYTRIETSEGYEERLIASLIESPKQEKRMLTQSDRGIAWWGVYKDDDERIISPIVNEDDISEILSIFNIKRYKDKQTGTTIIIPYVGELSQPDEKNNLMPWEHKDQNIIDLAVQRWYMPRLYNKKYTHYTKKSALECSVNNEMILPKVNTEPIFEIFQELYNAALSKESKNKLITIKDISFRAMKNSSIPVGTVAFREVSRKDLKMHPPHNKKSALEFIGYREKDIDQYNNSKIMAYSRSPGMIVEYSVDGDWFPKELIQKEDHLLCAFFVPNSEGELSNLFTSKGFKNLEAYLRSTENADHANWEDEDGYTIVQRAKNYTSRAILQEYQTGREKADNSATSALSRKFGGLLLPPTGFGKVSTKKVGPRKNNDDIKKKNRKSDLTVIKSNLIGEDEVLITVKLNLKNTQNYKVFLQIITQEQKLTFEDWMKTMGEDVMFPFIIKNAYVNSVDGDVDKRDEILITDIREDGFEIKNEYKNNLEIEVEIKLVTNSKSFIPGLAIRSL